MKISNKFPHNITVSSTKETFFFEPILTDELGLCYTFNSRISPYLSPKYAQATMEDFLFVFLNFPSRFSFLVSGNLENNSSVKSLEEISYLDGDASAVTSDLTNNVDVKTFRFKRVLNLK
jgi:hypothetical protein